MFMCLHYCWCVYCHNTAVQHGDLGGGCGHWNALQQERPLLQVECEESGLV